MANQPIYLKNYEVHKIAGLVVLFQPTEEVISIIETYVYQVEKLYLVDNSDIINNAIVNRLCVNKHVEYIPNGGNKGIAHALNRGAELALKNGYSWLLTMDQDTPLPKNYVSDLLESLKEYTANSVGIICPRYTGIKAEISGQYQNILLTMTSGNLLRLETYSTIGPFLDSFFIDHVDHEYCLRLALKGYLVVQVNAITLPHKPGKRIRLNFLGRFMEFSSHSPERFYYFCRNGYYVVSKYHKYFPGFTKLFLRLWLFELGKIIFQESRLLRMKLLFKSLADFYKGAQGKLNR